MTELPRPRVLHVTTTAAFVRHILIHDLRRLAPHMDSTVACAGAASLDDTLAGLPVRLVDIPIRRKISPLADLRTLWILWRLMRKERFTLVHTYVPKGGLLGQLAAMLARTGPRIHSCRGLLYTSTMPAWRRRLYRLTDALTNRLADRTIYISRADLDWSCDEGLCRRASARFTGSGIDLGHFRPEAVAPDDRAAVRARLGLAHDQPLLLTVGRFVADKGYPDLAVATGRLMRAHERIRMVWIAPVWPGEDGVLGGDVIREAGLENVVTHLPEQEDLRPFYAAADLLVHPSHREGVPRVLMEAAAMGLPIVGTDIPGCREVVTDGVSGYLCPPRDPEALAKTVAEALSDRREAGRRAALAARDARERFDQDRLTDRIWNVYQELLRPQRRSSGPQ